MLTPCSFPDKEAIPAAVMEALHHSFSLWGKAGEVLGLPRVSEEAATAPAQHCSHCQPAPSQLQWESQPQRPGNQEQIHLIFTKEQWGSLEMLLLETSQAAILFCLPSHISSTANSSFPRKTPHSNTTIPSLISTLCSPPASQSGYTPSIHPSQQCSNSSHFASALILSSL